MWLRCACSKPFSEEQFAAGWATFEGLLGAAERHLAHNNTKFLTGNTLTMAVSGMGQAPACAAHALGARAPAGTAMRDLGSCQACPSAGVPPEAKPTAALFCLMLPYAPYRWGRAVAGARGRDHEGVCEWLSRGTTGSLAELWTHAPAGCSWVLQSRRVCCPPFLLRHVCVCVCALPTLGVCIPCMEQVLGLQGELLREPLLRCGSGSEGLKACWVYSDYPARWACHVVEGLVLLLPRHLTVALWYVRSRPPLPSRALKV